MEVDNERCPKDRKLLDFLGYETYFDGRYSLWRCICGVEVARKEPI